MTLEEMRQEVSARGYDYIAADRISRFLNNAYQQICSRYLWPFLETEVEGPAPLQLNSVRKIISVRFPAEEVSLIGANYAFIANYFANPAEEGTPEYWWLDNDTIRVYPVSTDTIAVRYLRVPTELGDGDTPLIPERWQYLIIERAVVDCLRDDDEYEEARALYRDVQEQVRLMAGDLMRANLQTPRMILRAGGVGDYL